MQQLYFVKKGMLEWRDVKEPVIENDGEAIVRPFAAAKCDLDDLFLFQNISLKLKLGKIFGLTDQSFYSAFGRNFFKGPFPFGHECVAEVTETGSNVKGFRKGDIVVVPFQISCGTCIYCSKGLSNSCNTIAPVSTYGFGKHLQFGGAVSDLLKVPYADAMLLKIPLSINPLHLASLADNVPDAYRTVGPHLEKDSQKTVLIVGGKAQSIGLYSVLIAKAMNSPQVDYVSRNTEHLKIALQCGADRVISDHSELKQKYDVVVDASANARGLEEAIRHTEKGGVCTSVGIYIKKTTLPLIDMYVNGIHFITGMCNARADAEKVLSLIANKKLDLGKVTSKLASWEDASEAFLSKTAKVIVERKRLYS